MLTHSVVVTEWALPDRERAVMRISSDRDGADLRSWQLLGLLGVALIDLIRSRR